MKSRIALCVVLLSLALGGRAEVADSGPNGFTVKITTSIHASPADVYRQLIYNIGYWWSPQHTFSGDALNLTMEERVGGCFCEKLPNGGEVRHMEVIFFAPGKTLRLSGGLGPLQAIGANAALTFSFSPGADGTTLEATYAVSGYLAQGMNSLAAPVDRVLGEQITRLKEYVESRSHNNSAPQQKKP